MPDTPGASAVLQRQVAASGAAAFVGRTAQGMLSLATAVVMARLLSPADFGVFAMVMPAGVLAIIAANYCVQAAYLQFPPDDDGVVHEYYRFSRRVALWSAVSMAAAGPLLAWFYDEPRVIRVAVAFAVMLALFPRAAIQEARLKHALRFPLVHGIQFCTWTLGMVSGVVVAWTGGGYWALPAQVIVMESLRILVMHLIGDWRPHPTTSDRGPGLEVLTTAWRSLFTLRMSAWINQQPDLLVIGKLGGAAVMGSYDAARRWAWYPFEDPYLGLTEVAIASLGRVKGDPVAFRRMASRFILGMLTVSLPVVAFLGVAAESVVLVVLGEDWRDAVPFLRILSVAVFAGIITRTTAWVLLGQGNTPRLVRLSLVMQAPAFVVAALLGSRGGAHGVALAMAAASLLLTIPMVHYSVSGTPLHLRDVARAAARPVAASFAGGAGAASITTVMPSPGGMHLLLALAAFIASFVLAWFVLPGGVRESRGLRSMLSGFPVRGEVSSAAGVERT